ncbi:MAG: tetratricopeptide repeat protein [Bacteroidales bacterium]
MIYRKLIRFFLVAVLVVTFQSSYSLNNYDERLYGCFVSSNMAEWERVMTDLERDLDATQNIQIEFQLLHAQYGYIGFLIGSSKTIVASEYIAKADKHIEKLLKANPRWVEVIALNAAILAYKIAIAPYKVIYLGARSVWMLDDALEMDSDNPFVLIEKGNSKHYAPSFIGGNPQKAIAFYQKAANKIKESNQTKTWWYLNTLTQMALAAEKAKDYKLALKIYKEILSMEPNFKWVKDDLYPRILKK